MAPLGCLQGHQGCVVGVRLCTSEGRLYSVCADRAVRVWGGAAMEAVCCLRTHDWAEVVGVSAGGGRAYLACGDGSVRVELSIQRRLRSWSQSEATFLWYRSARCFCMIIGCTARHGTIVFTWCLHRKACCAVRVISFYLFLCYCCQLPYGRTRASPAGCTYVHIIMTLVCGQCYALHTQQLDSQAANH